MIYHHFTILSPHIDDFVAIARSYEYGVNVTIHEKQLCRLSFFTSIGISQQFTDDLIDAGIPYSQIDIVDGHMATIQNVRFSEKLRALCEVINPQLLIMDIIKHQWFGKVSDTRKAIKKAFPTWDKQLERSTLIRMKEVFQ